MSDSGEIGREELPEIIGLLGYTPNPEMFQEAFEKCDKNKYGEIGFEELVTLMRIYRQTDGFTTAERETFKEVERFRAAEAESHRDRAGFSEEEVNNFREESRALDKDRSGQELRSWYTPPHRSRNISEVAPSHP